MLYFKILSDGWYRTVLQGSLNRPLAITIDDNDYWSMISNVDLECAASSWWMARMETRSSARTAATSRTRAFQESPHQPTASSTLSTDAAKVTLMATTKWLQWLIIVNFEIAWCLDVCQLRLDFEVFDISGVADTNEVNGGICQDNFAITVSYVVYADLKSS